MLQRDPRHDILALADGTISSRRRARVLARVAADPEARRLLEQQQRVRSALLALPTQAPSSLRTRVEHLQSEHERQRLPPALTRRLMVAVAVACAAFGLALALTLTQSESSSGVEAVASIVHRPALEEAPRPAEDPSALDRSFAGVQFPSWNDGAGWRAIGARRDTVAGRATDTVFYFHEGHRVSYSVVSGPPLEPLDDARRIEVAGTTVYLGRDDEHHTVVTFERAGRTCVLAGHVLRDSTLVELAGRRSDEA